MDVHVQMEGHMRTQKKVAICEPRQEVSEETNAVNILISDFQVTELSESTFMLFKPLLQSVTALAN